MINLTHLYPGMKKIASESGVDIRLDPMTYGKNVVVNGKSYSEELLIDLAEQNRYDTIKLIAQGKMIQA